MKKNNIKTRLIAGILSAVTVCSVGTVAMTSVSAATATVSAGTTITNDNCVKLDKDLTTAKKITSSLLFKALDECTPWGKFVTPALGGLLDAFVVNYDPTTEKLNEISDKIDKLSAKLDAAESSLKAAFTDDLGIQSFYNALVNFKSDTKAFQRKITEALNSGLGNADKIAKIASLTGKSSEWQARFEKDFENLNTYFQKPAMTKEGNIFDLTYNYFTNEVMLSGEALDKAKPICDFVMATYSAGCSAIMESLSAQLYVNCLSAQTKATIDKDYMAHICTKPDEIAAEISHINQYLITDKTSMDIVGFRDKDGKYYSFADYELSGRYYACTGEDYGLLPGGGVPSGYVELTPIFKYDPNTFMALYQKTFAMSKSILVDNGHAHTELKNALAVLNHKDNKKADGKYCVGMGSLTAAWFNDTLGANAVNADQVKRLAADAGSKGITLRRLLDQNGFNTSKIPKNANLVTQGAWDDSDDRASIVFGYNYQKAYYKGINIDATNPDEQTIQLLDCGENFWTSSKWNYMLKGYACVFQAK